VAAVLEPWEEALRLFFQDQVEQDSIHGLHGHQLHLQAYQDFTQAVVLVEVHPFRE
jgi:hypothetical protein